MHDKPTLEYASAPDGQPLPGAGSSIASFCLGCLAATDAIFCIVNFVADRPSLHGDADFWMITGDFLLLGAIVALLGLACAWYGRVHQAPARKFRRCGAILNGGYLIGYLLLLATIVVGR